MGEEHVKDAVRIRRRYRNETLYCVLTYDEEGAPYALQISVSGEVINFDQRTLSNIDVIARFVTLSLREYELSYIIGNLMQMSRGPSDLACIIAELLLDYGDLNVHKAAKDD